MTKPLCLAITGCSGVGKTKLATYLSEKYQLPICPVGSRSVAKSLGFDNPYDVDAAGMRFRFQEELFLQKDAWETEHAATGFVTDRTAFDNLAYSVLHGLASQIDTHGNGTRIETHSSATRCCSTCRWSASNTWAAIRVA